MEVNAPESMTPWLHIEVDAPPLVPVSEELTVGEVASLVGISVRTLHHWDSVDLVQPHGRTAGGYRAYSATDVERIHRVLVYQELGFSLRKIAALLDDPAVDEAAQLRQQRILIEERIGRLRQMAEAVDQVLASRADGKTLTAQQQAEIFGRGWREDWAEEARQRWGASDEWAQFERNAVKLSEADRERIRDDGEALYLELADAKRSGVVPGSDSADRLAEQHRAMVGHLFDCTHSMQVCLGQHYVGDERFKAYLDDVEPGLSEWLVEVINANARRNGVDPDRAVWE
ncbi:MerR family transcriptional regulator [Agromyces cerinus]|uniref:DNA-binding transcriptional regulator, MerR family n=1 Tax=Agromyces cerinus subsp. cerinus TaxID=232089 RepID=A0A1N6ET46_9MICO|nr:MerR family transcriptional regulator [Agromyces cerinus]SIN86178.1 DNA-binding transcriptional regulator, MerR family [Agromyces cerinus subsp. cerinus]